MRIINVIKVKCGVVDDMESYAIIDEQLSSGIISDAEEMFKKSALELGADEEQMEMYIENGYFQIMNASVCITWSDIDY